jgi:hypothetical protein
LSSRSTERQIFVQPLLLRKPARAANAGASFLPRVHLYSQGKKPDTGGAAWQHGGS